MYTSTGAGLVDSVRSKLSDGVNWVTTVTTSSISSLTYSFNNQAIDNQSFMETEMEDSDSLMWSSDDSKSNNEFEENYFAIPIDDSLLQSTGDIEDAIDKIKALVLETEGVSEERRKLVKRLISLRIRLEEVKEIEEERGTTSKDELRITNGHQLLLQSQIVHRSPQYCDRCGGIVWTVIQYWYRCKGCAYQCHSKCINSIVRKCPALKVSVDTSYIGSICPEVGLPDQNYKCYECKGKFTLKNSWMEPRRCDYNGRYYCPMCHKNNVMSIPARIVHNWDFEEKRVSEYSRQFLSLMSKKPNMNLEQMNPKLFSFVEELSTVKRLREDIIMMKDFFMTCRNAISQKLLRRLSDKQYFVETSYMYSLQDLIDIDKGTLLPFLETLHEGFLNHIKQECEICKGKGFICEICENVQVIYPFDSAISQCSSCHTVFHSICFAKRETCPKCLRISKRLSSSSADYKSTLPLSSN